MDFDIERDLQRLLGRSETSTAPPPSAPSAAMEGITDPATATADSAAPTVVSVPVPVTRQEREAFFYEGLVDLLNNASPLGRIIPPAETGKTLQSDSYYVTWPLFILPKASKGKGETGFTHPFVSDKLPLETQVIDLGPKGNIVGYNFRREKGQDRPPYTLTTVDPIFVGIQVKPQDKKSTLSKRIPVLAVAPKMARSLDLKLDIDFRESVIAELERRERTADESEQFIFAARKSRVQNSLKEVIEEYKKALEDVNLGRDVRYFPVAMNSVGSVIEKEGIKTRYFIIETETPMGESLPTVWMTEELFVGRDRGARFMEDQKRVVELPRMNQVQTISMEPTPKWYRGRLFKSALNVMTVQQSGVFILPKGFVPVPNENQGDILEFELYLAYIHTKKETTLVWRNPNGKFVPITILVATNTGTDRISDLNDQSWDWVQTNLCSRDVASEFILDTIVERYNKGFYGKEFAEYMRDNWDVALYSLFRTPKLWDMYSVKGVEFDTSLEKYFREILSTLKMSYDEKSRKSESRVLRQSADENADAFFGTVYSALTLRKAADEIIYGVFSTMITKTRNVLTDQNGILSIYNSNTIAVTSVAKLMSDPSNNRTKHFYVRTPQGSVEASTRGKTVHLLFEQGRMYLLRMRNKVALVQVRAVNETGIILERGELVQVLEKSEYERGLLLRVATTGSFSLAPENGQRGVILIDPHVQWNGEFILVSKDLLEKTYQESVETNMSSAGTQELLNQKFKVSDEKYKYSVVQEIYLAEFTQEKQASEILGPIKGGLQGSYQATLDGLKNITFGPPPP